MLNKLLGNLKFEKRALLGNSVDSFVEDHPTLTSAGALGLAMTEYAGDMINSFRMYDPSLQSPEIAKAIRDRIESEGVTLDIPKSKSYKSKYNPKQMKLTIDSLSAGIPEFLANRYGAHIYDQSLPNLGKRLMDAARTTRTVSKFAPLPALFLIPHDMYQNDQLGGAVMNAASLGAFLSSPLVMHRELEAIDQAKKIIAQASNKTGIPFNRSVLGTLKPGLIGKAISSAAMVLVPQILKERMQREA